MATASATAPANNASATPSGRVLDVATNQTNEAYVRAQSENDAANFGALSAVSYGVGNTAMAGNSGQEVDIDNTQLNEGGGVEVLANLSGGGGYDALASSTAVGNASSGYACAECNGRMTVSNRQTNSADIAATSTTTITGTARTATGYSSALGNTACYYVTRPQ